MVRFFSSVGLFALLLGQNGDLASKYPSIESYEIEPGVQITPFYSSDRELCEVGIEKRHYNGHSVDMDAVLSKEQILSIFDQLAPIEMRGLSEGSLPVGSEITEEDGGVSVTMIRYENVSLAMYGRTSQIERKNPAYGTAIVSWKRPQCEKH